MDIDYEICYKNHNKIVKIYNYLNSNIGKKNFQNKIKYLKEPQNKLILLVIFKQNWNQYYKLIKIIKDICLRITKYQLSNPMIQKFVIKLYKSLDKINDPINLHKFIYQLLNDKTLYNKLIDFYGLLSDKTKCIILLRN